MKCYNCGGNVDMDSGKCPFCDTQYFDKQTVNPQYLLFWLKNGTIKPSNAKKLIDIYYEEIK